MSLSLSVEQRSVTVRNSVVNMRGIGFFSGKDLSEAEATAVIEGLESQAYSAAASVAEYARCVYSPSFPTTPYPQLHPLYCFTVSESAASVAIWSSYHNVVPELFFPLIVASAAASTDTGGVL
jgi:hypothetical protein